ncbi:germination protein, Ger(x)C family [Anaerovirgula multivorans]|uniref:Germination protein, Ger(X)C family n=1 Tax=Anaerovirgula multivorans TaxID=312168 RepID=A0A239HLU6_9FIRM|nr:Ger(x)C family spore germination protein [Anaerovirgula multivorans]SNS82366.1 germination protein, Ger(x)C family [Anaerovirgula multivorans]
MKVKMIAILLLCSIFLTGCFSYIDINRVIFVTALIIDVDEEGAPIFIAEAFHSFRSNETNTERGNKVFYKSKGETVFDAVRQLNAYSSYKLNYTQNRAIIFTERAARHGLKEFLDFLHRDQELLIRTFILIYIGNDPEELMETNLKENEYLGLYLYETQENPVLAGQRAIERFNQYLNNRLKGRRVDILTTFTHDKIMGEDKINIAGAAVMQEDKLVSILSNDEVRIYHLLMDTLHTGLLIVPHPAYPDKKVVLEVLKGNTKTSIKMEENTIILKKSIDIRTTFAETQESIVLDQGTIEKLQQEADFKIENEAKELFNLYKEKGIDLFDVQDIFETKYPQVTIPNVMEVTDLEIDVNVKIEGSTDILNFR